MKFQRRYSESMLPPEFRAVMPEAMAAAWHAPIGDAPLPFSEELQALGLVARSRSQGFTAGRSAAHQALSDLGAPPEPLLIRPDRSPDWPAGYCGSITHTASVALAVVARVDDVTAVGVDLEVEGGVGDSLVDMICSRAEQERLNSAATWPREDPWTAAFCAKEAVYKCQSPVTGDFLEFHDVELIADGSSGSFRAVSRRPTTHALISAGRGKFARAAGCWLALFWVEAT